MRRPCQVDTISKKRIRSLDHHTKSIVRQYGVFLIFLSCPSDFVHDVSVSNIMTTFLATENQHLVWFRPPQQYLFSNISSAYVSFHHKNDAISRWKHYHIPPCSDLPRQTSLGTSTERNQCRSWVIQVPAYLGSFSIDYMAIP